MTSYKKSGSAVSFDALGPGRDYIFNPSAPSDISFPLELRGSDFVALCIRTSSSDDKDILSRALARGSDYSFDGRTLTVFSSYLSSIPRNSFLILSAVFSRGQSYVFSVFSQAGSVPARVPLLSFSDIKASELEGSFKNEYFTSEKLSDDGSALVLGYDYALWPSGICAYFEKRDRVFLPCAHPYAISMLVWGDSSYNRLTMRLYNRTRTCVMPINDYLIDWSGWREIQFRFPDDLAMPVMLNELVRLSRGPESRAISGEIMLADISAVCSREEADTFPNRGIPHSEIPWNEEFPPFEFHGTRRGCRTHFSVSPAKLPAELITEFAVLPTGEKLVSPVPAIPFDAEGRAESDCFTLEKYPEDTAFALRLRSGARLSETVWLVTAEPSPHYSPVPSRIIRCITKVPSAEAAFCCCTDALTESCAAFCREAGSGSDWLVSQSVPHFAREAERTAFILGAPVTLDREYLAHDINISGLKPDTLYECRIGGEGRFAEPFCFRTLPKDPERFSAVVLSDAQNGRDMAYFKRYREVIEAGLSRIAEPTVVLELGDMVNTASDMLDYEGTIAVSQDYFERYPFAPTPGNHERDIYHHYENYKNHWNLPPCVDPRFTDLEYSFDIGSYHFVSICADGIAMEPSVGDRLRADLASTKCKWKVVLAHCSPYGGKGIQPFNRDILAPILDEFDVDLVLSGHEHIYSRSSVSHGERVPVGDGVTYITAGTSGPKCYENDRRWWQDFVYGDKYQERFADDSGMNDQTTATAVFERDRITIDVKMISGRFVDKIVLEKK